MSDTLLSLLSYHWHEKDTTENTCLLNPEKAGTMPSESLGTMLTLWRLDHLEWATSRAAFRSQLKLSSPWLGSHSTSSLAGSGNIEFGPSKEWMWRAIASSEQQVAHVPLGKVQLLHVHLTHNNYPGGHEKQNKPCFSGRHERNLSSPLAQTAHRIHFLGIP